MGSLLDAEQRKLAYFHALGKVMTENITQEVYNSDYKSSHNVRLNEIWSDIIYTAATFTDAYEQSQYGTTPNSAVTFYSAVTLTQIPGSNGMSYYYNSGGTFVRPWISPVDVPNEITNIPSYGFDVKLYTSGGIPIDRTDGAWSVDYYAGIIHFGVGKTPTDLGWGSPMCSFFQYSGKYGSSGGTDVNAFTTVTIDSGTSIIYFNSGLTNPQQISLSYLNVTGFTTVEFDAGTNYLWFNRYLTGQTHVDLTPLKGGGGGGGHLSTANINMIANVTNSGSTKACDTAILWPAVTGSTTMVFINGIQVNVGNLTTDDCYFSADSGVTAKAPGYEQVYDELYWNYVGGVAVAGYDLSTVDRITFTYLYS